MPSRRRSSSVIGGRRRQSRRVSRVIKGRRRQSRRVNIAYVTRSKGRRYNKSRAAVIPRRVKKSVKQYGGSNLSKQERVIQSSVSSTQAPTIKDETNRKDDTKKTEDTKRKDKTVYHCIYGQSCHSSTQGYNAKLANELLTFVKIHAKKQSGNENNTYVIILLGPTDEKLEMRNALLGNAIETVKKESFHDSIKEPADRYSPICIYSLELPAIYHHARIEIIELCSHVSTRQWSSETQHRGSVNTFENIIELIKIAEYLDLDFNTLHHWSGVGVLQIMRSAIPFYTRSTTTEINEADSSPFKNRCELIVQLNPFFTDKGINLPNKPKSVDILQRQKNLLEENTVNPYIHDNSTKTVEARRLQLLLSEPINESLMQQIYIGNETDPGMLNQQKNAFTKFCEFVKKLFSVELPLKNFHSFSDQGGDEYKNKFEMEKRFFENYLAGFNNGDIIKSYVNFIQMTNEQRGTFPMSERTY